jgi:O-antigen/teichoic acid export membrane protein
VVFAQVGAIGPLIAALASSVAFCGIALYVMRHEIRWSLNVTYLRQALVYSLPILPHLLGWQVIATADRFILNRLMGTAAVGVYNVGAMFGMIMEVIGQGANRAYVPLSMGVLKKGGDEGLRELREMGTLIVATFALGGAFLAFFSRELVFLFTAPPFHDAAAIVPFIAFAGAANGIYYVLINVLFYDMRATRYLPLGTATSAVSSVGINLFLVPSYGILGAGIAALASQLITTVVIGVVARRFDPVRWPYGSFTAIFVSCFALSMLVASCSLEISVISVLLKVGLFGLLVLVLSRLVWGDPFYLVRWLSQAGTTTRS